MIKGATLSGTDLDGSALSSPVSKSGFDFFGAGFFFLVIWCAGVIVPLYPFIKGVDA